MSEETTEIIEEIQTTEPVEAKEFSIEIKISNANLQYRSDFNEAETIFWIEAVKNIIMKNAFDKGEDVHARTAADIFGGSIDQVDETLRRMAKAVNFGIIYGLSAFGLSRQLNISRNDAKNFIDQYFLLYTSNLVSLIFSVNSSYNENIGPFLLLFLSFFVFD